MNATIMSIPLMLLNDQENEDLQLDMQGNGENDEESFNEQAPSHLASNSDFCHASTIPTIACHIQPTEISDDFLRVCKVIKR